MMNALQTVLIRALRTPGKHSNSGVPHKDFYDYKNPDGLFFGIDEMIFEKQSRRGVSVKNLVFFRRLSDRCPMQRAMVCCKATQALQNCQDLDNEGYTWGYSIENSGLTEYINDYIIGEVSPPLVTHSAPPKTTRRVRTHFKPRMKY